MLTESQQNFFIRLSARWPDDQVRVRSQAGRTFHYITARMLQNRLDDVAGPTGWYPEYKVNEHGLTCRLHLRVPDDAGEWTWLYKEDGGGFAGMASGEDDQKSGYSDALKRAGVAWGIGRYLYREGVPDYLGDQPPPPETHPPVAAPATNRPAANRAPAATAPATNRPAYTPNAAPARGPAYSPPPAQSQGQGGYDNFRPPARPGPGAFAWLKGLETHFGSGILKMANDIAKHYGLPTYAKEWDETSLELIAWEVIDQIRTWDNYGGEFEHVEDPRPKS